MAKASKLTEPAESDKNKKSLFSLNDPLKKQLKYIAFMDEKTQTEVVSEALTDYIAKWEKKNGEIPKGKKA